MKQMSNLRLGVSLTMVALVLVLSGCVGYQLGGTLPPGITSIYVSAFVNESREPQIETQTTRATIQEFQRDGSLKVTSREQADAILEVTLTGFRLDPLRYRQDQALTAQEYRQKITARIVLKRRGLNGEIVLDRTVQGEATFDLVGDLSSSKDRALPEASRDLAHDIVECIVEYW